MASLPPDSSGSASDRQIQELIDRLEKLMPNDAKAAATISALKTVVRQKEKESQAQEEALNAYQEAYEKLTQPAHRIGVFLRLIEEEGLASVVMGDTEYIAALDPHVDTTGLKPGSRVRLNEAYAVVGVIDDGGNGNLIKVIDSLSDGRLKVGSESQGGSSRLIGRAEVLKEAEIKAGDEIRLDATGRLALEHFPKEEVQDYFIEEIPETPWSSVGGQEEAITLIKETIEQPLLYPELYAKFDKKPVKGILLYGPPGCGKTLIGKAIAYNLAKDYSERTGREVKECFLHISGPKILNMWLGETERMVREIFATARSKAKEGRLVVIFIDEAESILRTRSGGRWMNISNTVVPQFNAEMDGLISLENVVVVLTSNRPDYIDPAILRPERIDRKIKIRRPDRDASKEILSLYLSPSMPLDADLVNEHDGEPSCARVGLIEGALAHLWRETSETEFLRVFYRNGGNQVLFWKDMVSGALIKSVVDRAKHSAIRRAISEPSVDHGVRLDDLKDALKAEFSENEIFPKSDLLDDWLKLIDVEPESVSAVKPVKADKGMDFEAKGIN